MMRPRTFGTLFYANYLIRAIALYRSLEAHFRSDFTLVMLCMDEASVRILNQLQLPRARIVSVAELEQRDAALAAVKAERSIAEYSWTCAPPLLIHLLEQVDRGDSVAYLDADLMFFSDPQPMFNEWGINDILIHEHRFAPQHRSMQQNSGVFNVGFVGVRNSSEGWRCVTRWREQCLVACRLDPERGLCGDQKYLEEWPDLYDRLVILRHIGAGLAPWNIDQYSLSTLPDGVAVDGLPLIFYHYHSMRIVCENLFGQVVLNPALGYNFTPKQIALVYRPYARRLRAAYADVRAVGGEDDLPRVAVPFMQMVAAMRNTTVVSSSPAMDTILQQCFRLSSPGTTLARYIKY